MSLVPCVACADAEARRATAIRQAIYAQDKAKLTTYRRKMDEVAAAERDRRRCEETGHASMQAGRDAARARHAAGRS